MAIRDVCVSGCTYSTIAAAQVGIAAADIIELRSNITENVDINQNFAELRADGNRNRTLNATSGGGTNATLKIQSGLTQTLKIKDLIINKTGGVADAIIIASVAAGQVINFVNCQLESGVSGNEVILNSAGNLQAGNLLIQTCDLIANASGSVTYENSSNTTALSVRFENSIFKGGSGTVGTIDISNSSANTVLEMYYCDIHGNSGTGSGLDIGTRAIIQDCVFFNNTDDVLLSGSGNAADFTFCAFEQQGSPFGSNNLFGINPVNEFVNELTNFHLLSGASLRNAGVTVTGITTDKDGVARDGTPDIGAFEFVATAAGPPANSLMMMGVGI